VRIGGAAATGRPPSRGGWDRDICAAQARRAIVRDPNHGPRSPIQEIPVKKLDLNRETLRSINLGQAATVAGAEINWCPVYTGDI